MLSVAGLLWCMVAWPARTQDPLLDILQQELDREQAAWDSAGTAPYFVSFRVDEVHAAYLASSFGVKANERNDHYRVFTPMIRIGSPQYDNYHPLKNQSDLTTDPTVDLPLENERTAVAQAVWLATDLAYRQAQDQWAMLQADQAVNLPDEDPSDDYTTGPPEHYYERPIPSSERPIDLGKWEKRLNAYTRLCKADPQLLKGLAVLTVRNVRKYYLSSEGSSIVHNLQYAVLSIDIATRADDGMELPLYVQWFAFTPQELPDDKTVLAAVSGMMEKIRRLREAPVAEPYSGPALLSSDAAGVFFHEIFGHRMEGQRIKDVQDGQTFKHMVGQAILPDWFHVWSDPTQERYGRQALNGHYLYDDEGVKAEKVELVQDGVLHQFLMSRTPVGGFPKSNGHGRAEAGCQPVARQSNLFVESRKPYSESALRTMLLEEVRAQQKPYGYYFANVSGGFTQTGRYTPNSFNVTPIEVYRIYADGRPDELVRGVDLIGTPLAMFSQIAAAGDAAHVFTGSCGAESGSVPVSCIAPMLYVRQIETQRQAKSQRALPILPNPIGETHPETQDDLIMQAMQDEMNRTVQSLQLPGYGLPYWTQYTLLQGKRLRVMASLGALLDTQDQPLQCLYVNTVIGHPEMTNLHYSAADYTREGRSATSVITPDYDELRRQLWLQTDQVYKQAAERFQAKLAFLEQLHDPEAQLTVPDMPERPATVFRAPVQPGNVNRQDIEKRVRGMSSILNDFAEIYHSQAGMEVYEGTYHTVTSEGTRLVQPTRIAVLSVAASTLSEDGMTVEDQLLYHGLSPDDLPADAEVREDVRRMADHLTALRRTPPVDENYTGPVLMEGLAAARYLGQALFAASGQGLSAYRPPVSRNTTTRLTEERLHRRVLPADAQLVCTPYLHTYQGTRLWGSYDMDAEGVAPDSVLALVSDGMLQNLLTDRIPTERLSRPTGNRRWVYNPQGISSRLSPGVLQLYSRDTLSYTTLRHRLIDAAIREGLDYAYIVRCLPHGYTPWLYKVYVSDGHEEPVRNGHIEDVTLRMLRNMSGMTAKTSVHNMLWSNIAVSFICPEAILIDELDIIKANTRSAVRLPEIPNPIP